jgi:hypothetical protein
MENRVAVLRGGDHIKIPVAVQVRREHSEGASAVVRDDLPRAERPCAVNVCVPGNFVVVLRSRDDVRVTVTVDVRRRRSWPRRPPQRKIVRAAPNGIPEPISPGSFGSVPAGDLGAVRNSVVVGVRVERVAPGVIRVIERARIGLDDVQ